MKSAYGTAASSDPAASVEHAITFSTGPVILTGFRTALVADANAANRHVRFTIEDASGRIFFETIAAAVQTANQTRQYVGIMVPTVPQALLDTLFVVPLPPEGVWIPENGVLRTATTSVQATDNYGVLNYQFKRPQ
jgi:hypothetical protein